MSKIEPLSENITDFIKKFIELKAIPTRPPIRDDIFNILEKYCTVLYFPLEDEENDGCHVKRYVCKEVINFVYINTHKSIEKQIFTAAHELGHILELDKYLKKNCSEYRSEIEEHTMNRFAALILMPDDIFTEFVKTNFKNYSIESNAITMENLIKFSVFLMDYFFVPFKSVVIRLYETNFLSKKDAETLINNKDTVSKIGDYIKLLGYKRLGIRSKKKSIKDFATLLNIVEKNNKFSETKIKSIREIMDLPAIDESALSSTLKFSDSKSEQ
jgi:Zn-dependent peptidase ImmA (M78 family)